MSVTIFIPTPLRPYTDNNEECSIELEGTVQDVLTTLTSTYPGIKPHLFDSNDNLRKFLNIYVNDTDIRDQSNEDTHVKAGDNLSIIPAIAGGIYV